MEIKVTIKTGKFGTTPPKIKKEQQVGLKWCRLAGSVEIFKNCRIARVD